MLAVAVRRRPHPPSKGAVEGLGVAEADLAGNGGDRAVAGLQEPAGRFAIFGLPSGSKVARP